MIKPNIKRLVPESNIVEFEDGTSVQCDNIIYATGYQISFPFFDKTMNLVDEETNKIKFYKYVFPPNYANIAFIGFIQPLGAIFPIAEISPAGQLKYSQVLSHCHLWELCTKTSSKKSRLWPSGIQHHPVTLSKLTISPTWTSLLVSLVFALILVAMGL